MLNLNTAEELIDELLDISKTLSKYMTYESQKPVLDLAQEVYKKEILCHLSSEAEQLSRKE